MNKLYEKFCNSMDYRTYKQIENGLLWGGAGTYFCNLILKMIMNPGIYQLDLISIILYLSYFTFMGSDGKYYTKDISEIKLLYQEFITNYNKMNKTFGFDEPVSIYTMFSYLIRDGYLSKDKEFRIQNNSYTGLGLINGVDVINGSGVCRHITSMLTDILIDYQINACNVSCYSSGDRLDFVKVNIENYSRDKNIKLINKYVFNENEKKELIYKLDKCSQMGSYLEVKLIRAKDEKFGVRTYGNHLITYALYDDKSYYLDPTNCIIFRLKDDRDGILYSDGSSYLSITSNAFSKYNDKSRNYLSKCLKKPNQSISFEE